MNRSENEKSGTDARQVDSTFAPEAKVYIHAYDRNPPGQKEYTAFEKDVLFPMLQSIAEEPAKDDAEEAE